MILPMLYMLIACAGQIAMIIFLARGRSALPGRRLLIAVLIAEAAATGAYALMFGASDPRVAYLRWLTIPAIGGQILLLHLYAAEFNGERATRVARRVMVFPTIIFLTAFLWFVYASLSAKIITPAGGYPQFVADGPSRVIGMLLLLFMMSLFMVGVITSIRAEQGVKSATILTTIWITACFFLPGVINVMYRRGFLAFDAYALALMIFSLARFAPLVLIYARSFERPEVDGPTDLR